MEASHSERETLVAGRFVRRMQAAAPSIADISFDWRVKDDFALAEPTQPLVDLASSFLRKAGFRIDGALYVVRHQAGDRGLPALTAAASHFGFTIDLTDARRTLDGGILLFAAGQDRVIGWRAETGALTIWNGEAPNLTELAACSPDRLTLAGRAAPL